MHGSGTTSLIISDEEMNNIMKIVQALEDCNILIIGVTKIIKNETKEQKGEFLSMLLGTLGASLLGNSLTGKGIVKAGSGNKKEKGIVRAGSENKKEKRIARAGTRKQWHFKYHLPLTNFEIQKYINKPRFNGVFSRNNLRKKVKYWAYVINLDEYADVGTHWIALSCNRIEIVYFDSFVVEHIPEEIKIFFGNKNIKENITFFEYKQTIR